MHHNISQVAVLFNHYTSTSSDEPRPRHKRDPSECVDDAGIQVPDLDGSRHDYVREQSPRPPYDNNHDVPCDEREYSHGGRWLDRKYCSNFVVGSSDALVVRESDEVRKSNAETKCFVGIDNTRPAILAWRNACLRCDCKETRLLEKTLPNPKLDAWKEGFLLPSKRHRPCP